MLLTTVRHVGVLGTFLPPAEPVPLVISDFVRSAVAGPSRPFLVRGWSGSGVAPVPLVISDFGACFCCCMSGSRARVRTCSFFVTFSLFAVAACCAENGRARAHVLLFWHFVQLSLCTVSLMKSRARVRTRGFLGTSSSFLVYCSEHWLRRNRARACAHAGFLAPRLVYCLHLGCSGPLLGSPGLFWASSGLLLGSPGPLLGSPGLFWATLGPLQGPLGLFWALLDHSCALLGSSGLF